MIGFATEEQYAQAVETMLQSDEIDTLIIVHQGTLSGFDLQKKELFYISGERDTYGGCELTTKSIPRARLDAIPWARFTVEAQAQLEREGALRQKRPGTLGTIDNAGTSEAEAEEEEPEEKPVKEKE